MKVCCRNLSVLLLALWWCVWQTEAVLAQEKFLAFVPASMTDVMGLLSDDYEKSSGNTVKLVIAGTAQLARQIDNGAPADIFISADKLWIDWLENRNRVSKRSAQVVAGNELVIAVRNETENWVDHKALLTDARFAMAEPDSIPAGRYAKQSLEKMGLWEDAQEQAVYGENVRVTLVYATDVAVEPVVKTAWSFPADSYDKVQYFAVPIADANPIANEFVNYLLTSQAQKILGKAGFKSAESAR